MVYLWALYLQRLDKNISFKQNKDQLKNALTFDLSNIR